jgi:hypothetical protein
MFTIVPHNLYLRKPGETIELPCDAVDGDDNHKPKIAWLRVSTCHLHHIVAKRAIQHLRKAQRHKYQLMWLKGGSVAQHIEA